MLLVEGFAEMKKTASAPMAGQVLFAILALVKSGQYLFLNINSVSNILFLGLHIEDIQDCCIGLEVS